MAPAGFRRETHLLTLGIHTLDVCHAALPLPAPVLQLTITNLRNCPLSSIGISSMRDTCLSLYHSLVTGSSDFPRIPYRGYLQTVCLFSPFREDIDFFENARPSALMDQSPGLLPLTPLAPQTFLMPAHPEWLSALRLTHKCHIRRVTLEGRTVTRVISPVYHADGTQLSNRWRVTDYHPDGHVLYRFAQISLKCAERPKKRGHSEEDDSDSSRQRRIRV